MSTRAQVVRAVARWRTGSNPGILPREKAKPWAPGLPPRRAHAGAQGVDPGMVPNLELRFLADDASVGLGSGQSVTAWPDASGNGRNATQPGGTNLSTWQTAGTTAANGHGGVRGDQASCSLATGYGGLLGDFTCVLCFRAPTSIGSTERIVDKQYANGFWMGRNTTTASSWGGGCLQAVSPFGTFVTLADGSRHVLAVQRQGTTWTIRGDGNTATNSAVVVSTVTDATVVRLLSDHTLASNFGGDLYELCLWSRALALTRLELVGVEQYLASTYGVTTLT